MTLSDETNPAVYLPRELTPDERALIEEVGIPDDAPTPMRAVAKIAVRVARHAQWTERLEGLWRRGRLSLALIDQLAARAQRSAAQAAATPDDN